MGEAAGRVPARARRDCANCNSHLREMGGAPRNPAPRSQFLAKNTVECPPLVEALPLFTSRFVRVILAQGPC